MAKRTPKHGTRKTLIGSISVFGYHSGCTRNAKSTTAI